MAKVGGNLSPDNISVSIGFAMQVLVSVHALDWRHGGYPEVIAIGADEAKSLHLGQFDLESQAIDADDIQRTQCHVRGHQQDGAATRMGSGDEANGRQNRPAEQKWRVTPCSP